MLCDRCRQETDGIHICEPHPDWIARQIYGERQLLDFDFGVEEEVEETDLSPMRKAMSSDAEVTLF